MHPLWFFLHAHSLVCSLSDPCLCLPPSSLPGTAAPSLPGTHAPWLPGMHAPWHPSMHAPSSLACSFLPGMLPPPWCTPSSSPPCALPGTLPGPSLAASLLLWLPTCPLLLPPWLPGSLLPVHSLPACTLAPSLPGHPSFPPSLSGGMREGQGGREGAKALPCTLLPSLALPSTLCLQLSPSLLLPGSLPPPWPSPMCEGGSVSGGGV
jgi:hypothetical protein